MRKLLIAFSLLFTNGINALAAEENCLHIASLPGFSNSAELVATGDKIFASAGLCARITIMPVVRSERLTLDGKLDGQLLRTRAWAERFGDEFVIVPTPVYAEGFDAVFLMTRNLELKSMQDLRGLSVAMSLGHRWAESQLKKQGIAPVKVSSFAAFGELLASGDVDVGIAEHSVTTHLGSQPHMRLSHIGSVEYHVVLRGEHRALVPAIDLALQQLNSEDPGSH